MLYLLMEESLKIRLEHERRSGYILGLKIARGVARINKFISPLIIYFLEEPLKLWPIDS
jgi:NurA-like 5'-3' nuclease